LGYISVKFPLSPQPLPFPAFECTHLFLSCLCSIQNFLDEADNHGKKIVTVPNTLTGEPADPKKTVSYEARVLKKIFLQLRE